MGTRGDFVMSDTLQDKLKELEQESNALLIEVNSTLVPDYLVLENEINSFKVAISEDADDPALAGVHHISSKAAQLSRIRDRIGELYSKSIKHLTTWKDLSENAENLYEKFKNLILSEDEEVQERKNQALQLAYVNCHASTKLIQEIISGVKKQKGLADSFLHQCEQVIAKVEFADKCLDKQIKSIHIQLYIGEVPKRTVPLTKYIKISMDKGKPDLNLTGDNEGEENG